MGDARTPAASLQSFQRDFAAALFGSDDARAGCAAASQAGFDVYRNTIMVACVDALAASFPSVFQLVGEAWFRDAAALFVRGRPPTEGGMASYGEGFAEFLADFEPARELPYLPGVARLDRLWSEAHLAADGPVVGATALAALAPSALAVAVLVPHPSARWASFADLPVVTIWRRHREGLPLDGELPWVGESVLLARPAGEVRWQAMEPSGVAFLAACASGRSFADAVDAAEQAAPGCVDELGTWLPALLAAGAFTRIEGDSP